jgi:hypothetical protein
VSDNIFREELASVRAELKNLHNRVVALSGRRDQATRKMPDLNERFWSKVVKSPTGCWTWTGAHGGDGYPTMCYYGRHRRISRLMWASVNGEIAPGALICHKCNNRGCVNPDHLYQGTIASNNRDLMVSDKAPVGMKHGKAKFTDAQILEIYNAPGTDKELSKRFGIPTQYVSKIKRRVVWKCLTGKLPPAPRTLERPWQAEKNAMRKGTA